MADVQRRNSELSGGVAVAAPFAARGAAAQGQAEPRLRLALETAGTGIWEWNVATGEVRCSRELARIRGARLSGGGGLHALLDGVCAPDRRRVLESLAAAMDGEGPYRAEFRVVREGGECAWVEERGRVFFDAAGEPEWVVGVCRDASDRAAAEAALAERDDELSRQAERLAERDEELSRLAERLAERDRHKDDFLAMLAHELRNPLTPIVSAVQMLSRAGAGPGGADGGVRERALAILSRQVDGLRRMVADILDVGRAAEGRLCLDRRTIDAREVVELAVDAAEPVIRHSGHVLTTEVPDEATPVFADPARLAQVVANLLDNAAKYTPGGGRIGVRVRSLPAAVEIAVEDDGVGIPRERLPHVFEAFTQREQGLDRAEGGLGLGLKLARELIHLHGGAVGAHSGGRGQGSAFVVRIPSGSGEDVAMTTRERDAKLARTERRVLVVDDSVDLAETLAMVLEEFGHEVRLSHTGAAALAEFDAFAPDIVFLDIGLPEMNGYDVARALRAREPQRRVLLIALSGYGEREDRDAAEEAGFDDHLLKPVDIETLEDVIEHYERADGPRSPG